MERRPGAAVRRLAWGVLQEALSSDEKSRLGVALYDVGDEYRDAPRYAWEEAWLARWLPVSMDAIEPAVVMVGAAGAGREVIGLLDRGCRVIAIEPSSELAVMCRARCERWADGTGRAGDVEVIEARYEELGGRSIGPVHAALLGLGSLSHVLDAGERATLFDELARACPRGPILASTLAPPRGMSIEDARREGRAAKMGRALGRTVRAARGLDEVDAGEIVFDALGFAKMFTREELRAIGEGCGRRTIFEERAPDGMLACAFVPG